MPGEVITLEYYVCDHCNYQFAQEEVPERCPDCGKEMIRKANEQGSAYFKKLQTEKEEW